MKLDLIYLATCILSLNLVHYSSTRHLNADDFKYLAVRFTASECDRFVRSVENTSSSEVAGHSKATAPDCLDKSMALYYLSNVQSLRDVTAHLRAINRHDLATQLKNRYVGNKAPLQNGLDKTNGTKSGAKQDDRMAMEDGDSAQAASRLEAWMPVLMIVFIVLMFMFGVLFGVTLAAAYDVYRYAPVSSAAASNSASPPSDVARCV